MRLYVPIALAGVFLVTTQPTPPAQDSKAEQGRAIAQIKKLGGTEVTAEGLACLTGFARVGMLDLGGTEVTDKGLAHLKGLTSLETLNLENTRGVSDFGLVHLKALTNLRQLDLDGTKVTDAG